MAGNPLWEAFRKLILEGPVRPSDLALKTGIPYNTLLGYCYSPGQNDAARAPKISIIIPLTLASGSFAILDMLEKAVGRTAFEIPKVDNPPDLTITMLGEVAQETAETLREMGRALLDGKITAEEAKQVEQEAYQAIQVLSRLMAAMEGIR